MSANNAVFILETPRFGDGQTTREFRAAYVPSVDEVRMADFANAGVYADETSALIYAMHIYVEHGGEAGEVEYGIQKLVESVEFSATSGLALRGGG